MMRLLRSLLILLTVLAFSVSSTGWSFASAGSGKGGHHAQMRGDDSETHHHDGDLAHQSDCEQADHAMCGNDHDRGKPSGSCCAMACHTAIPSDVPFAFRVEIAHLIDHPVLQVGVEKASGTRFERPPRSAGV